jgi:hypothetical protein
MWADLRGHAENTAFTSCFLYNPKFQHADCFVCHLLHAEFLLGSFFDHEDGSNMFFRNIG